MIPPQAKRFHCGGAIDPARQVYVVRDADLQVYGLLAQGSHVNLHSGRQVGKTSLMLNLKDRLTKAGHLCLDVELSVIFSSAELIEGLFRLRNRLREQLTAMDSGALLRELHHMPGDSIADVLRRLLLHLVEVSDKRPPGTRLYLMLDEIDILMRFPADESAQFFLALREFFNRPDSHGDRLILLLVSVLTPNEIILDHPTGGIGIGCFRDISLPLFDNSLAVRAQLLEQGFPERQNDGALDKVLARVLDLSGGQPFLTGLLCQELQYALDPAARFKELEDEVLYAPRSIAHNHLFGMRKQLADMGERVYAILETYRRVLRSEKLKPSQGGWNVASLENIGLLRLDDDSFYRIANPIYQAHFDESWVQELMSARETASQGKTFQSGGKRLFSKRRIALIQCGGTVGMVIQDGQTGFRGAQDVLSKFIRDEVNRVAQVEPFSLYQLDGINMTPAQWLGIAKLINNHWDNFDGFVVAHGTDTLAYTASAVAFMLGRVDKPVVFTGAQTTVDVLHGDARDNLLRACYAAATPDAVLETQICFGNLVLRAVRAQKADERKYQGFTSPGWPPLAQITEKLLVAHHALLPRAQGRSQFSPHLASEILLIDLVPGLRPDDYQKLLEFRQADGRPVQGLLITTPGLGNIPSEPPYNFRPLIQDAIARRIPVLISSQVPITPYTQDQYEMTSVPAQYGAIPAGNLTMAAALTKFAWVIGGVAQEWEGKPEDEANNKAYLDEVKKRMRTDYVGEEQQRSNLPS